MSVKRDRVLYQFIRRFEIKGGVLIFISILTGVLFFEGGTLYTHEYSAVGEFLG